jgi:hypothetical protein
MFVSGNDAPAALKALAAKLNVRICLDVEGGIRGDGPWVQGWLDASGAGLYGNSGVHSGRRAPFYILAAYPGSSDPAGTWWNQTPAPPGPCGWQWVGTHTEFGVGVDRGDYDDWFSSTIGGAVNIQEKRAWILVGWLAGIGKTPPDAATRDDGDHAGIPGANQIADDGTNLDLVITEIVNSPSGLAYRASLAKAIADVENPVAFIPHKHTTDQGTP